MPKKNRICTQKRQIRVHLAMIKTYCFAEEKSHLDVGASTLQLCDESIGGSASGADVVDDNHTFAIGCI